MREIKIFNHVLTIGFDNDSKPYFGVEYMRPFGRGFNWWFNIVPDCPMCDGTGGYHGSVWSLDPPELCGICDGNGWLTWPQWFKWRKYQDE